MRPTLLSPGRILFVLAAANCALIASQRVYPFVDLPFHLAAATILRHFDDPGAPFARYFVTSSGFPEPNIAHLRIMTLAVFPSVETANRVMLCGYAAAVPLLVFWIIARLNGNRWFALLSIPLLYNFSVSWGFAGYVLSIPLVLVVLLLLIDLLDEPRAGTLASIGLMFIVLFFVHVLAMLFAMLVCGLLMLSRRLSGSAIGLLALAMLPAAGLVAWWWLGRDPGEPSTLGFLAGYYRAEYLPTWLATRRRILTQDNAYLWEGTAGAALALLISLTIVAPVLWRALDRRQRNVILEQRSAAAILALGGAALLCSLVLPDRVPQQTALYERYSVFLLLGFVFAGSLLYRRSTAAWHAVLCLTAFAYLGLRADYARAFADETRTFTQEFLPEGGDVTLHGLVYASRFRGLPVYPHFPEYFVIWRRGVASTELTQLRFGVIRERPGAPRLPYYDTSPNAASADADLSEIDYLLVRGSLPDADRTLSGFSLERSAGDWTLYRNNRP